MFYRTSPQIHRFTSSLRIVLVVLVIAAQFASPLVAMASSINQPSIARPDLQSTSQKARELQNGNYLDPSYFPAGGGGQNLLSAQNPLQYDSSAGSYGPAMGALADGESQPEYWEMNSSDPETGEHTSWRIDAPLDDLEAFNKKFTESYGAQPYTGVSNTYNMAPGASSPPEQPQSGLFGELPLNIPLAPDQAVTYISDEVLISMVAVEWNGNSACEGGDADLCGWYGIDGTEWPDHDEYGPSGWLGEIELGDNERVDITSSNISKTVELSPQKTAFDIAAAGKEADPWYEDDEWFDHLQETIGPDQLSDAAWAGWETAVEHQLTVVTDTNDCRWKVYYTAQWVGDKYADLKVEMSKVTTEPGYPDETLTYRTKVTNLGANSISDIKLSNDMGNGIFVSHSTSGMSCDSTGETCTISNLAKDSSATVDIVVRAPDDSVNDLTFNSDAWIESDEIDTVSSNDAASLTYDIAKAPVDISISAAQIDPKPARPGGAVKYQLTVTNNGPQKAFNINLTNTIPSQFVDPFEDGDNIDCTTPQACKVIKLSPSSSTKITIEATVNENYTGNVTASSTVSVDSTMNTESNTSDNSTSVGIYVPPSATLSTETTQPNLVQMSRSGATAYSTKIKVTNADWAGDGWTTALDNRLSVDFPSGNVTLTTPQGYTCTPSGSGQSSTTCNLIDLNRSQSTETTINLSVPELMGEVILNTTRAKGYMDTSINQGLPAPSSLPFVEASTYLTNWDLDIGKTGLSEPVYALTYSDGVLFAAGGTEPNSGYLARWSEGSKSWSILGALNGPVLALSTDGAGGVYLGGTFSDAGGDPQADLLARYTAQGQWQNVGGGLESEADDTGAVFALALSSTGLLYAGGHFDHAGTQEAYDIATWDGASWAQLGPAGLSGYTDTSGVYSIFFDGDYVYLGGEFSYPDSNNVIRWSNTSSSWQAIGNVNGLVRGLGVIDDRLYLGGEFSRVGDVTAKGVAMWYKGAWYTLGNDPPSGGPVYALQVSGKEIYIGGSFGNVAGTTANNVARWNGHKWYAFGEGVNLEVYALAVESTFPDLVAGGSFDGVSGMLDGEPLVPSKMVARYRTPVNNLSITKTSDTTGLAGSPIVYVLTARNDGSGSATDVVVWDWMPNGINYQNNDKGCSFVSPFVVCNVGGMNPGQTFQVTINGTIDSTAYTDLAPIWNFSWIYQLAARTSAPPAGQTAPLVYRMWTTSKSCAIWTSWRLKQRWISV